MLLEFSKKYVKYKSFTILRPPSVVTRETLKFYTVKSLSVIFVLVIETKFLSDERKLFIFLYLYIKKIYKNPMVMQSAIWFGMRSSLSRAQNSAIYRADSKLSFNRMWHSRIIFCGYLYLNNHMPLQYYLV